MAWREILHEDISLLWEHNALTCHFNIMNNIILVFCTIHVTILFPQTRHDSASNVEFDCIEAGSLQPLLTMHTLWRPNISLNTLSMIFHILFEQNTTMTLVVMTVKYRLVGMLCAPTGGIYLYA